MSDFEITREHGETKGRYILTDRRGHAELTYSILSPQRYIADHTEVAEGLRGTGAGHALVARLVADAQDDGVKILPLCPFVNAERRKHPEWKEVFSV